MNRRTVYWIAILGFILICLLCIRVNAPRIEQDLRQKSLAALQQGGISHEDISFRGQDAILAGTVASPGLKARIREIVAGVEGVRAVDDRLAVAAPEAQTEPVSPPGQSPGQLLGEKKVEFSSGSFALSSQSLSVLDEAARILKDYPHTTLEIAGHADSSGKETYNLELSRKRAEAVKEYLITKGIAATRLHTAGYGAGKPVADNATPEGRQKNRRVEFLIKEAR